MKYILRLILVLFFLTNGISLVAQKEDQLYHSGLTFVSHIKNQDERTGLRLSPQKAMQFSKEGFSLEFEIKLREELHTYGYVCRVVSGNSVSFDVISHLLESKFNFLLTDVDKVLTSSSTQDSTQIVKDKWMKIKIYFTKENISINLNNKKQAINQPLPKFDDIKIYFGANKDTYFYTNDVPPMTVKNIIIRNRKDEVVHEWELLTHNQNRVYDRKSKNIAVAENPIWEIDKHTQWNKVTSFIIKSDGTHINPLPQTTFDENTGHIFIISDNNIYTYHIDNNKIDTITPRKGMPYSRVGAASQIIYDKNQNKLISYNPDLSKLNFFDLQEKKWDEERMVQIDTRQHHNRFIDYKNNRLLVFGGYGIHQYNSQFSEIKISKNAEWKNTTLNSIQPRYLSALGNLDDRNILILGGYGSVSGRQEESPKNYYDLHKVNIDTKESAKLWSFHNDKNHYAFSNSMVTDINANKIYALTYNNDRYYSYLYLSSFDIETDNPTINILSDSIKYNFLDIKSYCDLFLYEKTSTLYALVQEELESGESSIIKIYSLAFPPLSKEFIHDYEIAKKDKGLKFFLLFTFLIAVLFLVYLYLRRKKKNEITQANKKVIEESESRKKNKKQLDTKSKKSTINLLGGFRVYDKKGSNITSDFSPTIRLLMIYLLLSSIKKNKGTTSQKLDETFWFGMDKENASNNRRVNIRKLRLLIKEIGDVEITSKNSYWVLNWGVDVSCDYKEILLLLDQLKSENYLNKNLIIEIVEMASVGQLLPNIDAEWADDYKSQFSTKLLDILLEVVKKPLIADDPKLLLKISDVILLYDSIDEDAIRIKCRALYKTKHKGLSKQSYDKFCEDYMQLLNTKPDFSYEDIIQDLT